jgi:serine/threonine protein kinase
MARPPIDLDLVNFHAQAPSWRVSVPRPSASLFFARLLCHWELDTAHFLNSHTDLEDNQDWRPIRALGKGGYGLVGLWQKIDEKGTVLDSIAIKQQKRPYHGSGWSYEAELMHQLNGAKCNNIIKLRGFRAHQAEKLWRYYFEFAPFGNLHDLKINYMAWNTYLPEEFLWHIFHGLATAGLQLGGAEYWQYRDGEPYALLEDHFVLHFDLKPQNVVLGDLVDESPIHFSNYPVAKVMDFGLARITGPDDPENPRRY